MVFENKANNAYKIMKSTMVDLGRKGCSACSEAITTRVQCFKQQDKKAFGQCEYRNYFYYANLFTVVQFVESTFYPF